MKYEITCNDDFFEVRTFGDAELQGFFALTEAVLTHEKWYPGCGLLLNHADLNAAPLTSEDIRTIGTIGTKYQDQLQSTKVALLANRDLEFGLGRMWQVFSAKEREGYRKVFRSRDEAIAWLKEK